MRHTFDFDGVEVSTRLGLILENEADSCRIYYSSEDEQLTDWKSVANRTISEWLRVPNCGVKTVQEIMDVLRARGLALKKTDYKDRTIRSLEARDEMLRRSPLDETLLAAARQPSPSRHCPVCGHTLTGRNEPYRTALEQLCDGSRTIAEIAEILNRNTGAINGMLATMRGEGRKMPVKFDPDSPQNRKRSAARVLRLLRRWDIEAVTLRELGQEEGVGPARIQWILQRMEMRRKYRWTRRRKAEIFRNDPSLKTADPNGPARRNMELFVYEYDELCRYRRARRDNAFKNKTGHFQR